jgi:deoxycytidylate deaminase
MNISSYSRDCELIIGIVAPIGVNLDDVHNRLHSLFQQFSYKLNWIQVSQLIKNDASNEERGLSELDRLDRGMNNGKLYREKYRRGDYFALLAINAINSTRVVKKGKPEPLKRHAHVIRSLKHPDEVDTLRRVYGDGFFLLGVSASIESRKHYLKEVKGIPEEHIERLISRDDKEAGDWGQRTRDVFQLADAFVTTDDAERLSTQLSRSLDLLFSKPVVSPTADEYAMFMAYAASLRSADLSRQVGAVIANPHNDIIATGANDVPRFGGGLYWPVPGQDQRDYILGEDSNEREKRRITLRIMKKLHPGTDKEDDALIDEGTRILKDTGILDITEYGRAVHAEMEAITSAARNGTPIRGCTLYTTTYPCHNCAKHLVAAGIIKVKYVEPYPKSYAIKLHGDSIEASGGTDPGKVLFEPFVGIGPRRFVDLFSMSLSSGRNLQRKERGSIAPWKRSTAELRVPMTSLSYLDAELILTYELAAIAETADRT